MEKMLMEFERKKLLIQDDAEGLLQLANKMQIYLENKEENLEKLTDKLKKYPEVESEIVKFNVGGTQFATYKSTLIKKIRQKSNEDDEKTNAAAADNRLQYYEPHLLECMMNGIVKVDKDPSNGAIFIDRDPDYFKYILSYLRSIDGKNDEENQSEFALPKGVDDDFKSKLIKETVFFNLSSLKDILTGTNSVSPKSLILRENNLQSIFNLLIKDKETLRNKKWNLLYRATVDGFASQDFHRKCDNKGVTLTIIKSRDAPNVFGGFTSVSWESSDKRLYKSDSTAFIFSLVNYENMPLIFNCQSGTNAIFCSSDSGPTFGETDIYICSNCDTENDSSSDISTSYKADGFEISSDEAQHFLAGSYDFYVSEIEVFQII